ncbi:MAG TPA: hypothetical protein VGM90_20295 [Kofleriaceae bacterium]|jgi:hypothetical protein
MKLTALAIALVSTLAFTGCRDHGTATKTDPSATKPVEAKTDVAKPDETKPTEMAKPAEPAAKPAEPAPAAK